MREGFSLGILTQQELFYFTKCSAKLWVSINLKQLFFSGSLATSGKQLLAYLCLWQSDKAALPSICRSSRRRWKIWAITITHAMLAVIAFWGLEKQGVLEEAVKLIISWSPFPGALRMGWAGIQSTWLGASRKSVLWCWGYWSKPTAHHWCFQESECNPWSRPDLSESPAPLLRAALNYT